MTRRKRNQDGFTLIELIVTICIVAILASVAIKEMRDYTRRARISEVMMGLSKCKNTITEVYLTFDTAPQPGTWGCEVANGMSNYAGAVQTSSDGVVRVSIANLDGLVNGQFIYLVPARASGTPMTTPADLGRGIGSWLCGSDWQPVRNSLPVNCRSDTTTFASQEYH